MTIESPPRADETAAPAPAAAPFDSPAATARTPAGTLAGLADASSRIAGRRIAHVLPRAFVARASVVVAYALAMGYLESAVVVYLRGALGIAPGSLEPIANSSVTPGVDFAAIEFGREAATLVMLATVGWLAGTRPLERLAWVAVAFGVWDVSYYAWLFVFVGWPPSIDTWDLLFLIPVPWTAPVWAPCLVSAALVGFGLTAARVSSLGRRLRVSLVEGAAAIAGGVLVYLSFTIDAPRDFAAATARDYPWWLFATGMALAIASGVVVLRDARRAAYAGDARVGERADEAAPHMDEPAPTMPA